MTIHPNLTDLERAYRGPAVRPGVSIGMRWAAILSCLCIWLIVGGAALWVLS
jgi:hypothetical protein